MLKQQLFQWRKRLEETMDARHDDTMRGLFGKDFDLEADISMHQTWSEKKVKRSLTEDEMRDLREMLSVRGVRKAPEYADEPEQDRTAVKGGGGRKHSMGMTPPPANKARKGGVEATGPPAAKKARKGDVAAAGPAAAAEGGVEATGPPAAKKEGRRRSRRTRGRRRRCRWRRTSRRCRCLPRRRRRVRRGRPRLA